MELLTPAAYTDFQKIEDEINLILNNCSELTMLSVFDNKMYKQNSTYIWQAFNVYCEMNGGDPKKVAFKYIDHVRVKHGYIYFERPNMFIKKPFLPEILKDLKSSKADQ